ncbi:35246_t:CDS:2, partial [Gigaspora margarita]
MDQDKKWAKHIGKKGSKNRSENKNHTNTLNNANNTSTSLLIFENSTAKNSIEKELNEK